MEENESQKMRESSARKERKRARAKNASSSDQEHIESVATQSRPRVSFTTKLILSFVAVTLITSLVSIAVVTVAWNQYFVGYTTEKLENLAQTAVRRIQALYLRSGELDDETLAPAKQLVDVSNYVGVTVVDGSGRIIYNSTGSWTSENPGPIIENSASKVALANLTIDGEDICTVQVWVYGSNTLMTKEDEQFHDVMFISLYIAGLLAVGVALVVGLLFARRIVRPVNKITRTADTIASGDLSARTGLHGNNEILELGEIIDNMAAALEKSQQQEKQLTSDVAHELRTPLMAIQVTVEAIIDGVYEPDEKRLNQIDVEVQRLSKLVDALLKLSRLEMRSQPIKEEPVDLTDLIDGVVITNEVLAEEQGLHITSDTTPDIWTIGDADLIRQAVANLVSNAMRYTSEGGSIIVSVHAVGKMATIEVTDTGIGLTPEEEKKVFTRFWRADEGRTRESGGLGIGLAMVKEIVERQHGHVFAKGEKGVGSTFTIQLPLYDRNKERENARRALRSFAEKNKL